MVCGVEERVEGWWLEAACQMRTLSATIGPLVALVSAAIYKKRSQQSQNVQRQWSEAYNNAIIVDASDDCGTSARSFR